MNSLRAGIRSVAASVAAVLVVLVVIEIPLRIGHTVLHDVRNFRARESSWYRLSPTCNWERRPGFSGALYGTSRTFGRLGLFDVDLRDLKRFDKKRILLLGDSCTFGNGVAIGDTFGQIVNTRLPDYRTVNLGDPGYTSFQGLRSL